MSNSRSRKNKSHTNTNSPSRQWRRMDLHLHTPGSNDYQESSVSYLDILRQAEIRGLDIIAFTDHNTVAGFATMRKEVEQLLWLEGLNRLDPEEKRRLDEYRRLLDKILVLPGFGFTGTFGFHILGGGSYEFRTVAAMGLRSVVWLIIAVAALHSIANRKSL